MKIEDELRGALDVPAPPSSTTLEEVLKLGRRRVLVQRAGAFLGVAAVVVGIGVGAVSLNAAPPPAPADRPEPDYGPAVVVHTMTWPRVNTPPQQPYGTWTPGSTAPPPPDRPILQLPECDMRPGKLALSTTIGTERLPDAFLTKWVASVRQQLPEMRVSELTPGLGNPAYQVDLTDLRGTGSVQLTAGRFTGTPQEYADDSLWETGDCEPPYRTVLRDGTIVQLHSVHAFEPFQSLVQVMNVYRADGLVYQLRLTNSGSPDVRPDPKQPTSWERIGAGRPTLPLSDEQFSRLGPTIAGLA